MKLKRIIGTLLCVCLLLAMAAIPAGAKSCDCGEVVQIFMDGFGSALYYNYGTPEQEEAGMARTENLAFNIGRAFRGAGRSVWERSWAPLASSLGGLFTGIMGHLAMDGQGRSVEPITNHWRLDPAQDHRESPQYNFNYDFRIDPYEAASQLNEFVEAVCKTTGHSKVALTGHSEGSIVCMTYLKVYGTRRIDTFMLINGAWQGLTLVGEVLTKKFAISGASVTNFIANNDDGSGNLELAMRLLRGSHLLDFLEPLGEGVLDVMGDQIYDETLLPLFGKMPVLWAFVPQEFYPEARKLIAGQPEYAQILAKADKYHSEVQAQAGKLLKNAQARGVKVAIIASYGFNPMPVSQNSAYQCDTMIDTAYEAGFATAAPIGKTLPDVDSTSRVSKYRSPDGIFDASTCILPDQTWFVKDCKHSSGPMHELRQWIIHSKKQPTVWSNPDFPQYLVNVEGKAVALKG